MRLPFWKLSAAGNDFVLVERKPGLPPSSRLARRLCARRSGVGADGLLVVDRRPGAAYFNADGSEAFCGNGARCAAWWVRHRGWVKGRGFLLATGQGPLDVRVTGPCSLSLAMPKPGSFRRDLKLEVEGRGLLVHSVDTGVPHAVAEVPDLDRFPVARLGRALRRHRAFAPAGTNVDFCHWERGTLRVRTYERGVEDETESCGTGVVAAALIGFLLGRCESPVAASVRGGERLKVRFKPTCGGFEDVRLEGPVRLVFKGGVEI